MIITFKQHLFTITAIFAALCLGILIGSTVVGEDGLLLEQRKIISGIRKEIDNVELEKSKLVDELSALESEFYTRVKIEEKIFSLALKDFLENKHYYLFYENLELDKINELQSLVRLMGGELSYIKEFDEDFLVNQKIENPNLIKWNYNKSLPERIKNDKTRLIEYQEDSTLGLIYTIIEDEF